MNLASIIDGHPAESPAVISRGEVTDYGTLRDQVARLRGGLLGLGIEPGDRVALLCANNWYFVAPYLAILGAGAVAVPLNPSSPAAEIERELEIVGARALVVGPTAAEEAARLDLDRLAELEFTIAAEGRGGADCVLLDSLLDSEPADMVPRDADDLAVLMFTSGTAGAPKAAMLTHGNLCTNIDQVLDLRGGGDPDEVSLAVLPFFHIFGLNVILGGALRSGASVVLVERFDPVSSLETIRDHGVSVVAGAPTMWTAWLATPGIDRDAFETVRIATSGAAPLDADVSRRIEERFGLEVGEGYGLTEASPVVTASLGLPWRPGSVGAAVDRVELRIVDVDGADALIGDPGELWVRGPNVFGGYWEDPDATALALDADGWLHTGDIALVDEEGFIYLVDRAKDLVIVSGFNVYPAEVEGVIMELPGIAECAVVGVPHPHTGEAVKAFVVLESGISYEEDVIVEHCAEHLARYKCPQKVDFVTELPMNMAGKVVRRSLR